MLLWLLTSLFPYLMAYWRGGIGIGEEIDLPFGTISLFTSSVRTTLTVIYDIVVWSLVGFGLLGALCRIFAGPSTVWTELGRDEDPAGLLGTANRTDLLEEYIKASPFHAVIASSGEPRDVMAVPSLADLRTWLQAPV